MTEMDDTLLQCAKMMDLSALTAPKSAGQDFVVTAVLDRARTDEVGAKMIERGESEDQPMFVRDGKSVRASGAMLLVGLKDAKPVGLNCGACGFATCDGLKRNFDVAGAKRNITGDAEQEGGGTQGPATGGDFNGPICAFRLLDMGIALGSAVKTAGIHNADNRIMYRAGVTALEMGLIDADYVMAVPLSAAGKSVFFDR